MALAAAAASLWCRFTKPATRVASEHADGEADAHAVEEGDAAVQPREGARHADKRAVLEEEGEEHGSRRSMVLTCSRLSIRITDVTPLVF